MSQELVGLLPCPFCGSSAALENFVFEAAVRCIACSAKIVRRHEVLEDTGIPKAIASWNTRQSLASEPQPVSPEGVIGHIGATRHGKAPQPVSQEVLEALDVVIVEEVPGVEPHWWIKLVDTQRAPGPWKASPTAWFESHEQAVAWCAALGWKHTTNYCEA